MRWRSFISKIWRRCEMDNMFKKKLFEWTYDTVKSNPKKFGGDGSNSLIMQEYSRQFYNGEIVSNLNKGFFSILSTVSRIKNKLLENNPQFDFREKDKRKKKKISD